MAPRSRLRREYFHHDCLRTFAIFEGRNPRFLEAVISEVEVKLFQPGQFIMKEGDLARTAFFLVYGTVEVLKDPEETKVAEFGPGSVFGETALLTPLSEITRRTASVRATDTCDCRVIHQRVFHKILAQFPQERAYYEEIANQRSEGPEKKSLKVSPKMMKATKSSEMRPSTSTPESPPTLLSRLRTFARNGTTQEKVEGALYPTASDLLLNEALQNVTRYDPTAVTRPKTSPATSQGISSPPPLRSPLLQRKLKPRAASVTSISSRSPFPKQQPPSIIPRWYETRGNSPRSAPQAGPHRPKTSPSQAARSTEMLRPRRQSVSTFMSKMLEPGQLPSPVRNSRDTSVGPSIDETGVD